MEKKEEKISENEVKEIAEKIKSLKKEMSKIISGQHKVIDALIRALICNGHVFVEGVPGTAKTLIVKVLGIASGCEAKRVQFTVDLLPTDIIGLTIYKNNRFEVVKGPVFANFLIADEINRSPPKTQSALLEAMQEKQVTIGRETFFLPKPFFVMATANPIEQSGVYGLPEAQLDRFLFKVKIDYPEKNEEKIIMKHNVDLISLNDFGLRKVIFPSDILDMQKIVKKVYLSEEIENYIVDIVETTRDKKSKYGRHIDWGASPRASIALFIASKAEALMNGRNFVIPQDVKTVAADVLRHRIILSYEAEASGITADSIISEIVEEAKAP
jgi:MoxR-like ATPase